MKTSDIKKALESCIGYRECSKCPLNSGAAGISECTNELMSEALDLINRQKVEINQLRVKLDDCERDIIPKLKYSLERANKYGAETEADNIRLLKENERLADIGKMYSEVRAEAIKELAERLKTRSRYEYIGDGYGYYYLKTKDIDNLVKKMIGEKNECL